MSLSADNVRVGVTGAAYSGPVGTTAPTDATTAVTPRVDLGYINEDGVTTSYPGAGDSSPIKAWQNSATVRTIRTPNEDNPTVSFVLLETKLEVVEFALGVTVTQTATEGSYDIDTNATRDYRDVVIDVIDGSEIERAHLPKAIVTEIGDRVYKNDEPIGYQVTIEAERDETAGYNIRYWNTSLKS